MHARVIDFLKQRLDPALELLRQLVEINSYTLNRAGVDAVGQRVARAFAELGFAAERVPSTNPAYAEHLVLTRPGRSPRTIGLITHLDTVFPPEEEARNHFRWRHEGDRIYGPGTIDIKGGTVMIHLVLSALRQFDPKLFEDVTWLVLANSSEEVYSPDFGEVCLARLGPQAVAALVFEPGGLVDGLATAVTGRKGRATFHLEVEGKGAHAGGDHRRGANAVVQLSQLVCEIAALTDHARDLTFNVGVVAGGTVANRVPHFASAEIEMRAFTIEAYQAGMRAIRGLANRPPLRSLDGGYPCRIGLLVETENSPWSENPGTQHLFGLWREAGASMGLKLLPERRGGLSDGNHLWQRVPTLDGLGPQGDNAHCSERSPDGSKEQEYVDVTSFVPRAALSTVAILKLVEEVR